MKHAFSRLADILVYLLGALVKYAVRIVHNSGSDRRVTKGSTKATKFIKVTQRSKDESQNISKRN